MAFFIRLTDDERMLAESNAKLHSYSFQKHLKSSLEKIEVVIGEEAYGIFGSKEAAIAKPGRNARYDYRVEIFSQV